MKHKKMFSDTKYYLIIGAERLSVKLHDFMKSQRARQADFRMYVWHPISHS